MNAIEVNNRVKSLPPYLFVEIDNLKKAMIAKGAEIIDLGIGDPDMPTPSIIIEAAKRAMDNPAHHRYPMTQGMRSFRETCARWCKERFGIQLDPDKEVVSLIGSKEGIAHMHFAFCEPGDIVLVPEPGYPPYLNSTILCGATPYFMPLTEGNRYLPDLKSISAAVLKKSKIMFINYPNNPTAAVAGKDFYRQVVDIAHRYDIIVCSDLAYSEVYYDEADKPCSFLEVEGAKDVGIEFHSLSKTFNMTGWRIGFAAGSEKIVQGLAKFKSNIDSGAFEVVQAAAIEGLNNWRALENQINAVYRKRRDTVVSALNSAGFQCVEPKATFYVWTKCPAGYTSAKFCSAVLEKACVVVTPGNGFGPSGEGYFRISLTSSQDKLKEAVGRIARLKGHLSAQ